MRIAIYLYGLSGGGATRRTLALARGFREQGLEVDLVLIDAEGPLANSLPKGIRLRVLALPRAKFLFRTRRRKLMGAVPSLIRYLQSERPDMLLSAANHAHLSALWAAKLTQGKVPVVLRVSNHLTESHRRSRENIRLRIARWCYGWADAAIGVSEGISQDLRAHVKSLQGKVVTVHNPTFEPQIETLAKVPVPADFAWVFHQEGPVVLGAGRLTPQKDFATLIKAFARLRQRLPAVLVILGAGKQRRLLEQLSVQLGIAEDVIFPGFMHNPYAWMARADLFVLSSAWEGSPGVLIEAMACGCPVVSTRCPSGPEEILANGRYGTLVPVGDEEALTAAMLSTLSSPPAVELLKQRAREYSLPAAVEGYLRVFSQFEK